MRMRFLHVARNDKANEILRLRCTPLENDNIHVMSCRPPHHTNHAVQNPLICGFHHEVISSCRDFICQSRQISFFVPTKSGRDVSTAVDMTMRNRCLHCGRHDIWIEISPLRYHFARNDSAGVDMTKKKHCRMTMLFYWFYSLSEFSCDCFAKNSLIFSCSCSK